MATYQAGVSWNRDDDDYAHNRYSRAHQWQFDEGLTVPASASPHIVPAPWSDKNAVDPEEALVAALSSCHMLFFLSFAQKAGLVVESYNDKAEGIMENNSAGKVAMTRVTLKPKITFSTWQPKAELIAQLHHQAHDNCFIANSFSGEVAIETM